MRKKLHIKSGDTVIVLSGESKGEKGKIVSVDTKKERAIVEGVNKVKKHQKPNAKHPQGGIIEMEAPLHVSNLMVIDPTTGEPTKVGRRRNAEGKLERYSKKSGEVLK
jgi:large subunit ribosomal protein L24